MDGLGDRQAAEHFEHRGIYQAQLLVAKAISTSTATRARISDASGTGILILIYRLSRAALKQSSISRTK